jgi:HD-GYP domain-containing protein (c-di-GMP phosphodiesterase class II)
MRICPVRDLTPGMMLGRSIFNEQGQLLLRAGFTLDHQVLRVLASTGRTAVYIYEDGTEDVIPEDIISEEARSRATQAFSQTAARVVEAASYRADIPPEKMRIVIEKGAEFRNVVDVDRVTADMASVVDEILDHSAQVLNQTIFKSLTGYNTEHAVDTALISLLMGRRLGYSRRDLVELGMGAFLHDLGKLALPKLMNKPVDTLTEAEQLAMREHSVFGQQLLANSTDRNFMAQSTILHHHERQDGLGYPLGRIGQNRKPQLDHQDTTKYIFPFAEIVAVANTYDNLISPRNGACESAENAIRNIVRASKTEFNVEVAVMLAEVISIFPTGSMVRITECSNPSLTGIQGVVMRPNEDYPHRPILVLLFSAKGQRITPQTIDLTSEEHCRLELCV